MVVYYFHCLGNCSWVLYDRSWLSFFRIPWWLHVPKMARPSAGEYSRHLCWISPWSLAYSTLLALWLGQAAGIDCPTAQWACRPAAQGPPPCCVTKAPVVPKHTRAWPPRTQKVGGKTFTLGPSVLNEQFIWSGRRFQVKKQFGGLWLRFP